MASDGINNLFKLPATAYKAPPDLISSCLFHFPLVCQHQRHWPCVDFSNQVSSGLFPFIWLAAPQVSTQRSSPPRGLPYLTPSYLKEPFPSHSLSHQLLWSTWPREIICIFAYCLSFHPHRRMPLPYAQRECQYLCAYYTA